MSLKDSFTEEDWAAILAAPMITSFAITAADPNGLIGMVQEGAAAARALTEAREEAAADSLIGEVSAAYASEEGRDAARTAIRRLGRDKAPAQATQAAVAEIARIAGMVEDRAPAEAPVFKTWLMEIARNVAEAAKEGGFLGFGGETVSDAERKTLGDISEVLSRAV